MWQRVAAEELEELDRAVSNESLLKDHYELAIEYIEAAGSDDDDGGAALPCRYAFRDSAVNSSKSPMKPLLKKNSSLKNGYLQHTCKKRVRWADQERHREWRNRLRSFAPPQAIGIATVLILVLIIGSGQGREKTVNLPIQVQFQSLVENASQSAASFTFEATEAHNQQATWHKKVLSLDSGNNVIFHPESTTITSNNTFGIHHSAIQLKEEGLYLIEVAYEHTSDKVKVLARLPCSPDTPVVSIMGRRNSFHHRCQVLPAPQNVFTVAVSSPDVTGARGEFKFFRVQMQRVTHRRETGNTRFKRKRAVLL